MRKDLLGSNPAIANPTIERYGDLIFDLCHFVSSKRSQAQSLFRSIIKDLRKKMRTSRYVEYERALVIKVVFEHLSKVGTHKKTSSPKSSEDELSFASIFERLRLSDQIFILLHDRHEVPMEEIASALNTPSESLKMRRDQIFHTLLDWTHEKNQQNLVSKIKNQISNPQSLDKKKKGKHQKEEETQEESGWKRTPWLVRNSVEGFGITFIVLFILGIVPKIKETYDKNLERRLQAFNLEELALEMKPEIKQLEEDQLSEISENVDDSSTYSRIKTEEGYVSLVENPLEDAFSIASSGTPAFEARESREINPSKLGGTNQNPLSRALGVNIDYLREIEREEQELDRIRIGDSEIWRFNVKTDSPREMRPKIVEALTQLSKDPKFPGIEGVEAPGGIQFNLILPKEMILDLKNEIRKISYRSTSSPGEQYSEQSVREIFTWYRNKSRKRIPKGQTQVVIWLSQI